MMMCVGSTEVEKLPKSYKITYRNSELCNVIACGIPSTNFPEVFGSAL